ncbi:CoA transferase, partial [Colwellia sp. TT2012]|uniref:CoA transferase n=1 Tax=Colwellia sp. TT2012 TaxID=1720342 RepID=UPI000AD0442D
AVIRRLEDAQIASARVNDRQGVWDHPQLKARDSWREVDSPAGPLPSLLPPGRNSAFTPRMDAVPALGQHNQGILQRLGYTREAIESLNTRGII